MDVFRCSNCGLRVQRIQRYPVTNLPEPIRNIFFGWLSIQELPDGVICRACYTLVSQADINTPRRFGHAHVCVGCGHSVARARSHTLDNNSLLLQHFPWTSSTQNRREAYEVCHSCYLIANRRLDQDHQRGIFQNVENNVLPAPVVANIPPAPQLPPINVPPPNVVQTVTMPNYKRAANTSRRCIFQNCNDSAGFMIPDFIKIMLIKSNNFYIPRSSRVCRQHLYTNNWNELPNTSTYSASFTVNQIEHLIELLKRTTTFDFDNVEIMPNHICHYWTGLDVSEFLALYDGLSLQVRRPKTSLAAFLMKLRTGESDRRLSTLLDIPRATLENRMNKVRSSLSAQFVPMHIGLQHTSHDAIQDRNLSIPNAFFGSPNENGIPAIIICDGTYIYIQKSSNYFYQKATYSLHKYDNLIKPFLMVCCDGHILDVAGPYKATQTDAEIMIDLFTDEHGPMRTFFQENDVFILDCGFRDSIPLLEWCGYAIKKPESLIAGQTQLSTFQANKSRLVTMCRWVVEVVNGRFKRDFKLFRQRYFNLAHRHLMEDFKIAAALLNRFHPLIVDRPDAQSIIQRALTYLNRPNHLAQFVLQNNLNRRSVMFTSIDADLPQMAFFPMLDYTDLELFSCGPYQVLQARSYYGEHVRQNGIYSVEVCPDLVSPQELLPIIGGNMLYLIRTRIKSRHVSRRKYYSYVLVDAQPTVPNCLDCILGYYCSCVVGNRTVGCCCLVMTLVWYLGWARYQGNNTPPASFLDNILITINE